MMIFIIESVVLCVLFTAAILSQMKKPLGTILYSYPPRIVDRVIELGLVEAYTDYWFHIKGSLIGMALGLPACLIAGIFCQIAGGKI